MLVKLPSTEDQLQVPREVTQNKKYATREESSKELATQEEDHKFVYVCDPSTYTVDDKLGLLLYLRTKILADAVHSQLISVCKILHRYIF
mmetsp:Transcript_13905/g.15850  ORF Transcript_13905/g.15850 Transcript_13905/m.15850 type:complete len:90 (+) Transcript_13905:569-838(+)